MRYNHSYISLTVKKPLSISDARKWRDTVATVVPSGIVASASIMVDGNPKISDLYTVNGASTVTYVIPLSRDLLEDEAGKSAIAWSSVWLDGDFEVTFSQRDSRQQRKSETISTVLDQIAEKVAKMLHAEWLNGKVAQGWNYGTRYSTSQKKHPMLLPWEQLSSDKKDSEISRINKTFEILDSINLKIARK